MSLNDRAPYRVIYSNDVHTITYCVSEYHREGELFRPEMLEASVDETADTGIDVHKLVPGYGWVPRWKSEVYPIEEHYEWYRKKYGEPEGITRQLQQGYIDYMLNGGDYVQLFIDRCREKGLAPFVSLRNDYQGGSGPEGVSRFLDEHPEYRLFSSGYTRGCEEFMNWIHPEVREYRLEFVAELCEYDIDGLEIDLMRRPIYFRLDQTTAEERREIMTGFIGRVRELLDKKSPGGKHRWLCLRVPCHRAEYSLQGFDLKQMVDAGVDMINVSPSYFTQQQTDLAQIAEQVPQVAVYLEMSDVIDRSEPGVRLKRRTTDEQFYTAAHLAYARGATGVSTFNFRFYSESRAREAGYNLYEPPFHIFNHLGDSDWLAEQPQHYFLARGYGGYDPRFEGSGTTMMMRNARYAPQSPLPCKIESGQQVLFRLDMAPPSGGWKEEGRMRIQGRESLAGREYRVDLNGVELKSSSDVSEPYSAPYEEMLGKPEELRAWLVPPRILQDNLNRIELTQVSGKPAEIIFIDLAIE